MKDIALHILDVANNSVSAKATLVEVVIDEQPVENTFTLIIKDNGKGMSAEIVEKVTDPFYTTRTTRKVGMGIPLLKQNAEQTGGWLTIESEEGKGTTLKTVFQHDNIDRPPLGDIAGVMTILITGNPKIDFLYTHKIQNKTITFDTREIKEALEGVSINNPQIVRYLREMFEENIQDIINTQ
jgi:K+-sensing histidine kinase KdpD